MKALIIFILVAFSSCSFGQNEKTQPDKVIAKSVDPTDFKRLLDDKSPDQLLDVRTPREFQSGHLKKAQNINWNSSDFNEKVAKLSKDAPVFVYCHSGGRSKAAMKRLKKLGFLEIYELDGGISAWKMQKLQVVY